MTDVLYMLYSSLVTSVLMEGKRVALLMYYGLVWIFFVCLFDFVFIPNYVLLKNIVENSSSIPNAQKIGINCRIKLHIIANP